MRQLTAALDAGSWRDWEDALCEAADLLLDVQREAGLPTHLHPGVVEPFHDRPFTGIAPHVE